MKAESPIMPTKFSIRRAVYEDAPRLSEIHIFGWRNAYRGIVSDDYLFGKLRVEKRTERFRATLAEGTEESYVAEADGLVYGFMTIGDCRDADRGRDSFELWGIYVDPCLMRSGAGSALIASCEAEASRREKREVLIWVFEGNPVGRAFYEKHGYVPEGKSQVIEFFNAVEMRYVKTLAAPAAISGPGREA